jgi:hypothetical protein
MGLADIKTIKGFWNVFDKKYYNALAKASAKFAIEDVKSLDREERGFLREMRRRLNTHKKHMDKSNMGHHITNDMVKKHWEEAWDSLENYNVIRSPPLWPQFETLLEEEGEKAQSREDRRPREKNIDKQNSCNTWTRNTPRASTPGHKLRKQNE